LMGVIVFCDCRSGFRRHSPKEVFLAVLKVGDGSTKQTTVSTINGNLSLSI
jgi:hypothetical protein